MKIGILDVDGHNKKTRWGSAFPNLALMKISAWHKSNGDQVEWAKPNEGLFDDYEYDVIYASKVFTNTPDVDWQLFRAKEINKGGTGYEITSRLPNEIDRIQPDYSIYEWITNKQAYGFLTRGCPNKCKWCVVPKKEGAIVPYMDVEEIAVDGRNELTLMDNNILAAEDYALLQLEKIIKLKLKVDFNQALDARLVNDDNAKLLAKVKWLPYIRFGCDTHGQIEHCNRALELLKKYGWKGDAFLYCMITDNFEESIERVSYWRDRLANGERLYPHVQPYLDFNDPNYVPPKWQKDMARWSGIVSLKKTFPIMQYEPRKGFIFSMYRDCPELRKCRTIDEINEIINRK